MGDTSMDDRKVRCKAIGENESWMTIAIGGKVDWSSNLQSTYPDFMKAWKNRQSETGHVSQVVLGCNQQYFIKGTGWCCWRMDEIMKKHIDMDANCCKIDVLAFGQNGSYIVQFESGELFYEIDDSYNGLYEWIDERSWSGKGTIRVRLSSIRRWSSVQLISTSPLRLRLSV